jgi:hypothetical protein
VTEGISPSARIATSFKALAASSQVLNAASDELTKPIAEINGILQHLNLGLTVWERIHGEDNDGQGNYWSRDVGYTQIHRRWGIAIRTVEGSHHRPGEDDSQEWLFDEAPRSLRIDAVDKIPELLDKLIKASEKTARKLQAKAGEARELATALTNTAVELKLVKKVSR